jgi:hypothetical protein
VDEARDDRSRAVAAGAVIAVLEHLKDSNFSSTVMKNCEVTLPDGQIGNVNLTVSGPTVNKLWVLCCDSIIASCKRTIERGIEESSHEH